MKITRFPQSCLLLEKDGQTIVIDPGEDFLHTHAIEELRSVSAALYTHQHPDHYDATIAAQLHEWGVVLYANASTAQLIGEGCQVVNDHEQFKVAGFAITALELPHCLLSNGQPGPQNTGYVVDDIFFHPGDGKSYEGLQVDHLALPITGPDISMLDAFNFARQVEAKVTIPIHFDKLGANPQVYAQFAGHLQLPFEVRVLGDGESTDI